MNYDFVLKYDDVNEKTHMMDAYDVSKAISGFAKFSESSFNYLQSGTDIQPKIRAIRPGCVEIDFLIYAATLTLEAGIIPLPKEYTIIKYIKDVFEAYKHLKGKPAKSITQTGENNYAIENNYGTILQANQIVIQAVTDPTVGKSMEDFVKHPLKDKNRDLKITSNDDEVIKVSNEDSKFYKQTKSETILLENEQEIFLRVVKAVFEGNPKWIFNDGAKNISVTIEDETFIEKVASGHQRFGSRDHLKVLMRSIQKNEKGKLKAEYTILQVLDHINSNSEKTEYLDI